MPEEIKKNAPDAKLRPAPAKVSFPWAIRFARTGLTGLFLFYFLPVAFVGAGLILGFADFHRTANHTLLQTGELNHVELEEKALADYFLSITADLSILAHSSIVLDYLEAPTENHLARLNRLFRNFSVNKKIYSQIRYINATGQEVVQVNFIAGEVIEIPESQLEDRSQRYYFSSAFKLKQDEFYISPMDLSTTNEAIDQPLTPVIRFCTPVFDRKDMKRGIMVLNFAADHLLRQLQRAFKHLTNNQAASGLSKVNQTEGSLVSGVPMLINLEGFWLLAPDPADEWGFRLGHSRTFQQKFPSAWETIRAQDQGQIQTDKGLFSFTTVKPLANHYFTDFHTQIPPSQAALQSESNNFYWKMISFVDSADLKVVDRHTWEEAFFLGLIFLLIALPACWIMARWRRYKIETEKELRKNEEKFRTVSDFTYAWEYWIGPDGQMIYVSPAAARISGYSPEEFISQPKLLQSIVHDADQANFTNHLNYEILYKGVCHLEYRIISKKGDERWILHNCHPVYNSTGEYLGRRASNHDITQRKTGEMEREKLINELKAALAKVKLLSGFLPICASCKKIRDDKGYWKQIESYIRDHSEAEFSHGICPDCAKRLYPDLYKEIEENEKKTS